MDLRVDSEAVALGGDQIVALAQQVHAVVADSAHVLDNAAGAVGNDDLAAALHDLRRALTGPSGSALDEIAEFGHRVHDAGLTYARADHDLGRAADGEVI